MFRQREMALAAALGCAAILALAPSSVVAAGCPNEGLREEQGSMSLPECMALEMVSPPKKFSQLAFLPSFSLDGDRVLFTAQAALAGTAGYQSFIGDRYVATRSQTGWEVAPTSPPLLEIVAGGRHAGGPSAFTPDLDHWVSIGSTQPQFMIGLAQLFGGGLDGSFSPISPLMVPTDDSGSQEIAFSVASLEVDAASTDLGVTVIQGATPRISYLPGDPRTNAELEPGGDRNSYLAFLDEGTPTLELMARDKNGTVWGGRCGAHLGGPFGVSLKAGTFIQGAISASGSRLYFSTRPAQPFDSLSNEGPQCNAENSLRIMRRTATEDGAVIEPLLPGGAGEWEEAGDDLYEAGSANGTKVYFTSPRELSPSDSDGSIEECSSILIPGPNSAEGCDLYLFDSVKSPGERLIHVSAGQDSDPANVLSSITAASGDGSHVYFVAQGVLTGDNSEAKSPSLGQPNLYAYDADAESTTFIGVLSPDDRGGMWGTRGSFMGDAYAAPLYESAGPGGAGGDGHILVFASEASLTSDDEDGGFRDVFRYDADTEVLERISKAAVDGSDNGPFDVAVNPNVGKEPETNFGEQSRWVSDDGLAIAFATKEALVPADDDGETYSPYLWSDGVLGAAGTKVKFPPSVSPAGDEMAFSTLDALLPGRDTDTAEDVYVAREDGGFPEPPAPLPGCDPLVEGDCQTAVAPPTAGNPATVNPTSGNIPTCKRGYGRKKGHCVRKGHKAHRGKSHRRAGPNRRAPR